MIYTLFIFNVMIILHLLVRMLVNFIDNKPILEVTEVDILLAGKVAIFATIINANNYPDLTILARRQKKPTY